VSLDEDVMTRTAAATKDLSSTTPSALAENPGSPYQRHEGTHDTTKNGEAYNAIADEDAVVAETGIWDTIKSAIGDATSAGGEYAAKIKKEAEKKAMYGAKAAGNKAIGIASDGAYYGAKGWNDATECIGDPLACAKKAMEQAVNAAAGLDPTGIADKIDQLKDAWKEVPGKVTDIVRKVPTLPQELAKTIMDTIKKLIDLGSASKMCAAVNKVAGYINEDLLELSKVTLQPVCGNCLVSEDYSLPINCPKLKDITSWMKGSTFTKGMQSDLTVKVGSTLKATVQVHDLQFDCDPLVKLMEKFWEYNPITKFMEEALKKVLTFDKVEDTVKSLKGLVKTVHRAIRILPGSVGLTQVSEAAMLMALPVADLSGHSNESLRETLKYGVFAADHDETDLIDLGEHDEKMVVPRSALNMSELHEHARQHTESVVSEALQSFLAEQIATGGGHRGDGAAGSEDGRSAVASVDAIAAVGNQTVAQTTVTEQGAADDWLKDVIDEMKNPDPPLKEFDLLPLKSLKVKITHDGSFTMEQSGNAKFNYATNLLRDLNLKEVEKVYPIFPFIFLKFSLKPAVTMPLQFKGDVKGTGTMHIDSRGLELDMNLVKDPTPTSPEPQPKTTVAEPSFSASYVQVQGSVNAAVGLSLQSQITSTMGLCVGPVCASMAFEMRHEAAMGADSVVGVSDGTGAIVTPEAWTPQLRWWDRVPYLDPAFSKYIRYPWEELKEYIEKLKKGGNKLPAPPALAPASTKCPTPTPTPAQTLLPTPTPTPAPTPLPTPAPTPTPPPLYNYEGCYENAGANRVNGHTAHKSMAECKALAKSQGKTHFGMEYPQGSATPGDAYCLTLPSVPTMNKKPDSECENERDAKGNRLGDGNRLAVYFVP
jgi:hypothetical protein